MSKQVKLADFIKYLLSHVDKSIYVWGAQGQDLTKLTEKKIKSMETSTTNANRAIKMWNKRKEVKGAKAFDCSGLGMYWLQQLMGVYGYDMSSHSMYNKCTRISKAQLKKGDWVFRKKSSGKVYHIGYVVDDELNVVESYGRDKGVIKRSLNASGKNYWNAFGRLSIFKSAIEHTQVTNYKGYIFSRELKLNAEGSDVLALQNLLKAAGFSPGSLEGNFGKHTRDAVKAFQKANNLKIDGIAGENTIETLGGVWKDSDKDKVLFDLDVVLKRKSKGEDVRELQHALREYGYMVDIDGSFGPDTEEKVRAFQRAKKIGVDGKVGKITCEALGGKWYGKK